MKYRFSDLVDVPKLNNLMQSFYRATGIPSGIIDIEGNVLVAIGWQEICQKFHRKTYSMEILCKKSDEYIEEHLTDASPYLWYKCQNGLIDAVAPIIINGVHVASVFQGQFFFEKPDLTYFEQQAKRHGLDIAAYMNALAKVPINTAERLDGIMRYFLDLAEMLAELGMSRLKLIEEQAEAQRRSDEQIFRIFNSTPNIAIQGYDECGNINFWNNASERLYGFREADVIDRPLNKAMFHEDEITIFADILRKISATNSVYGPEERTMRQKDGSDKHVYFTIFPIRLSTGKREFICMDVDITEKKHFSKEIERLDRLHLVGEMAASLGHEIRNPMTTVRGYLQMMRNRCCYPEHENQFDLMIEELDRANQIITDFLSLARNKPINKRSLDLNRIIHTLMPLLYAEAAKENKNIHWTQGDIPALLLDEKEMRQLVLNLVLNAIEAVEQGGTISINTYVDNEAVILKIQDNGVGIPKDLLDKVGTPFFTTKDNGTGLGLAVCFSIANRHNAKISIQSNPLGTTIFVKYIVDPD